MSSARGLPNAARPAINAFTAKANALHHAGELNTAQYEKIMHAKKELDDAITSCSSGVVDTQNNPFNWNNLDIALKKFQKEAYIPHLEDNLAYLAAKNMLIGGVIAFAIAFAILFTLLFMVVTAPNLLFAAEATISLSGGLIYLVYGGAAGAVIGLCRLLRCGPRPTIQTEREAIVQIFEQHRRT